jgi:outer membrane protein OmpA-like peptidoglycan-associated protein
MSNRSRTHIVALAALFWLSLAATARAERSLAQQLSLRYGAGASLMVSTDQRSWLGYGAPGVLSDLQVSLRFTPLLAAQLGMAGGVFFSPVANGAVLAPMIGSTLHWPLLGLPTYLALNVGLAATGQLIRPFGRAVLGIDWSLTSQLTAGPTLGLDVVRQLDGEGYSTNAIYAWLGVGLSWRPVGASAPVRQRPALGRKPVQPVAAEPTPPPTAAEVVLREPAPQVEHEPAPPSPEIRALLDEAVHVEHTELLAPVLFKYDSTELEPSSVAMLHEVARLLNRERTDIQLLGVVAYSDAIGPAEYNLALSQRRAEHVRGWLVAHGVADARLTVEAHGASDPVEVGEGADQQQNRRVVFRVLRAEERP